MNEMKMSVTDILSRVRGNMRRLDLSGELREDRDEMAYFRYYGIDFPWVSHFFGSFDSGPFTLAGHVFQPENPKGTVFLVHGYFDHTGILRNLIEKCLSWRYATVTFDLPGHGISSGKRASIDDFGEYAESLKDGVRICHPFLPTPFFAIGHSTGGAVMIEYLRDASNTVVFDKTVLLAPLVRSAAFELSKIAFCMSNRLIAKIPRGKPKSSSDTDFLTFLKNDPLQTWHIPLKWMNAMYEWNSRIESCDPFEQEALIIQGTDDDTLDWRYNLRFLKSKFPNSVVRKIENGKHHLINETAPIQREVMNCIAAFLD